MLSENNIKHSIKIEKDEIKNESITKKGCCELFKTITQLFEVDLLKNHSYLNVIFGLSLFNVAESNFKLMTPFFLRNSIGIYFFIN